MKSGKGSSGLRESRLGSHEASLNGYAAALLVNAIEKEASNRRHGNTQVAVALGIHPAHWYRLRARPRLLSRCERGTHESIATYLRWPIGRVLLASGVIEQSDFVVVLGGEDMVSDVLDEIEGGPFGAGLVTPLRGSCRRLMSASTDA